MGVFSSSISNNVQILTIDSFADCTLGYVRENTQNQTAVVLEYSSDLILYGNSIMDQHSGTPTESNLCEICSNTPTVKISGAEVLFQDFAQPMEMYWLNHPQNIQHMLCTNCVNSLRDYIDQFLQQNSDEIMACTI